MTVCEKCIHNNMCKYRFLYEKDTIISCADFKDRSDFVELPCRCQKCIYNSIFTCAITGIKTLFCEYGEKPVLVEPTHYCGYGKKKDT